jgi:predicted Zn finger-like uncharacterized protein
MNIRCPACQTLFRVDPARVPPTGIRARCSRCDATFPIRPPAAGTATSGAAEAAPPVAAADVAPEVTAPPEAASEGAPAAPARAAQAADDAGDQAAVTPGRPAAAGAAAGEPPAQEPPHERPAAAPPPEQEAPPAAATERAEAGYQSGTTARTAAGTAPSAAHGEAAPGAAPQPVFGTRDPDARAQRVARALVSDIVAYHPERRDACLQAGTLRRDFRDEIMKSWEEYVAQVGLQTAKSTPYFRNALNEILAGGQQLF